MARPIYSAKKHGIEVSVWGSVDRPSLKISKRYKDKKTGLYKDSAFYYEDNIPLVIDALNECTEWLRGQRATGTVQTVAVLGTEISIKTNADDDIPW